MRFDGFDKIARATRFVAATRAGSTQPEEKGRERELIHSHHCARDDSRNCLSLNFHLSTLNVPQNSSPLRQRAPFLGERGILRTDRGAAGHDDHPKSCRQKMAVQTENFPQAAADFGALHGSAGFARGDHADASRLATRRGQGGEDHEASVPRFAICANRAELGAAGKARRLGQRERTPEAAERWREPDQAPVWRA